MGASVNNSASVASATPSTTLETASFAVGGTNRVLYVLVGSGATTPSDVSAVKWGGSGGAALTQIGATATVNTNEKVSLWRLIAPTAQTSTVHATWSGTDDERWIIAVAVEGADQVTPNGTVATGSGTNHAATVNATSTSGQLVLDFMSWMDANANGYTCSVGAGQTSLQNLGGSAISIYEGAAASWETASGASTTMSWAISGAGVGIGWYTFALAVNDASGGGGGGGTFDAQLVPLFASRRNRPGRGPYSRGRLYRTRQEYRGDPPLPPWLFDESVRPNALSLTNLSGAYTDIDEDPSSPDAAWLTWIH